MKPLILIFLLNICTCSGRSSRFTLSNIEINIDNNGTHTHFNLISKLDGNFENSWMAVGLNVVSGMVSIFFGIY